MSQSQPSAAEVPDAIEPVLGIRAWRIGLGGPGGNELLWSVWRGIPWSPGKPTLALCMPGERATENLRHPAPDDDCKCGLYAVHAPKNPATWTLSTAVKLLSRSMVRPVPVYHHAVTGPAWAIGIVAGWGRVGIASAGFRSQYQEPRALLGVYPRKHPQSGLLSACARLYDVPVLASDF